MYLNNFPFPVYFSLSGAFDDENDTTGNIADFDFGKTTPSWQPTLQPTKSVFAAAPEIITSAPEIITPAPEPSRYTTPVLSRTVVNMDNSSDDMDFTAVVGGLLSESMLTFDTNTTPAATNNGVQGSSNASLVVGGNTNLDDATNSAKNGIVSVLRCLLLYFCYSAYCRLCLLSRSILFCLMFVSLVWFRFGGVFFGEGGWGSLCV